MKFNLNQLEHYGAVCVVSKATGWNRDDIEIIRA
jgi:hypothetical protein